MLAKSLIGLAAVVARVLAQSTTDDASATEVATSTVEESATGTASEEATTHTVNVGASGHKFTPNEVEAKVGDVIEWRFYPSGHWVIRGDYDNPCIPYEYVETNRKGFSSGEEKVQAITDDAPRFRVRVNNTDPIFFYCGASGSCVKYKMMGVINPSKNETLKGWLENAEGVETQLRPGDPWPTEAADPTETAKKDDQDDESSGGGGGLSTGAIAGIAVGGAAVLLLAGALLYLCGRRGGFDKAYRKSFRSSVPQPPPVTETQVYSPNPTIADPWAAQKSPGLVASQYTQSPPISPHQSLAYGTHPGMVAHDGTPVSYHEGFYQQPAVGASPATTPKPPDQIAPVELPGHSPDPIHSPNPSYNNDGRTYSWHGDEAGYRPTNQ